jgi:hypothetical protein
MLRSATRQYRQFFTSDIDIIQVRNRIIEASDKLKRANKPEKYVSTIIRDFEVLTDYLKEFNKVNTLKSEEYKTIKKIYSSLKKDEGKYLEEAKERGKKEKAKALIIFNKKLDKFFNYEINYLNSGDIKEDYLRISADGTQIETTQQVKIDIDDARKLYRMILNKIDIKGHRISNYTVISLNGHLKIGCHNINVKNMHEVGARINNK